MNKKFAFMLMGDYLPDKDTAVFLHDGMETHIFTVRDLEEAKQTAKRLADEGYGVLELCGAFKEEGARLIRKAAGDALVVGYVVHFLEDDGKINAFFACKQ